MELCSLKTSGMQSREWMGEGSDNAGTLVSGPA